MLQKIIWRVGKAAESRLGEMLSASMHLRAECASDGRQACVYPHTCAKRISSAGLGDNGCRVLVPALHRAAKLKHLGLASNGITDEGRISYLSSQINFSYISIFDYRGTFMLRE